VVKTGFIHQRKKLGVSTGTFNHNLKVFKEAVMRRVALTILGVVLLLFASWGSVSGAEEAKLEGILNINSASIEQLQMLPTIDETLAQNIVYFREANGPFPMVDDLIKVNGMTDQHLEAIRPYVSTEGESTLKVME